MTLGGLVVALGVVVDDAVIDVENIMRRRRGAARGVDIGQLILSASLEVRRPVFYATAAVAVAFLPILMLSGLQGSFFRPLSIAFFAGGRPVTPDRDERDARAVRHCDGRARAERGSRVAYASEAASTTHHRVAAPASDLGAHDAARDGRCRPSRCCRSWARGCCRIFVRTI